MEMKRILDKNGKGEENHPLEGINKIIQKKSKE